MLLVTMLLLFYSAEGIVFAAESQITARGQALDPQQKVLRVPSVGIGHGLMGYFGLAQVRGKPLTPWLQARFQNWRGGSAEEFGRFLVDALRHDATSAELDEISGFHIGAFELHEGVNVPVFVYAHNCEIGENGYEHLGDFQVEEQLLTEYLAGVPLAEVRNAIRAHTKSRGVPFWLRNGDLRFFAPVWHGIEQAAGLIIAHHGYRTPNALGDWESLAKTLIVTTSQLYKILYGGGAPLIGNKPKHLSLRWP
jgi:hypothetical protein